jgi:hypothetical protein
MEGPSSEVVRLRQEAEYYRELALKRLEEIEWWKQHSWAEQNHKIMNEPQIQLPIQNEAKKKIILDLEVQFSNKLKEYTQEVTNLREENRALALKNETLRLQLETNDKSNHQKLLALQSDWQTLVNSAIKEETVRRDSYLENEKRLNDLRCDDLRRQIENLRQELVKRDHEIREIDIAYARKLADTRTMAVKNLEKEYLQLNPSDVGNDQRTIEMLSGVNRELRTKIVELERRQADNSINKNLEIARMKGREIF